jgi:phage terminase small subunit
MATGGRSSGGRSPKPAILKLLKGNPGHRPIPVEPVATGKPIKPEWLSERAAAIWDTQVRRAPWLTEVDSCKLALWCDREADVGVCHREWPEYVRKEHRMAGSEFGFDPIARARLGTKPDAGKAESPAAKYFGRPAA